MIYLAAVNCAMYIKGVNFEHMIFYRDIQDAVAAKQQLDKMLNKKGSRQILFAATGWN